MERKNVEQELKEITEKIVREYQPEKIILFGSWAWGNPGPDSDVDLFIVKDSSKPKLERMREVDEIVFPRTVPLDILVYTPAEIDDSINKSGNLFIEDIVRNGKTLYVRPGITMNISLPSRPLTVIR